MTLTELAATAKEFLTPEEVSGVIGCHPYSINVQAKADPEKLGFPVCVMGTRVKIPKQAFVRWCRYGNARLTEEEMEHGQDESTERDDQAAAG